MEQGMPNQAKWAVALGIALLLVWLGWKVTFLLVTLHVLVCFVLVIVIMLQSGNAADLAGAFGGAGSQTAFGPRGAASFLSKATTWCAIVFMMTSLTLWLKRGAGQGGDSGVTSVLEQTQKSAPAPAKPSMPMKMPATPGGTQQPPANAPANPPARNSAPAPAPSTAPKN
jgi:preprotein translocase subunit SecG